MDEKEIINILSNLKHRIFPRSFERLSIDKENLIGVEIGVYRGEHAESLLENLSIKRLYLIDPYQAYKGYEDGVKHYGVDQDSLPIAEKEAEKRLKKYSDRIVYVKKKSSDALNDIPNNLDFVYIDGNHQYDSIKEDIKNYYPKIKKGGIIGGHDMYNGYCYEHNGVIRAVAEFAINEGVQLHIELPDWWIKKGKKWF